MAEDRKESAGQVLALAAPIVTAVSPTSGPATGGVAVTITGSGFVNTIAVTFGGTPAPFSVVSDTQITAIAPAHAPGQVVVRVTTAGGMSAQNVLFTYTSTPGITSVDPDAGPTTGGTTVTLTGSGFTTTTAVTFGGTPAPFTVVSDTQITATTPAHAPGQVVVRVATPGGTSPQNVLFTYASPPTVTSLNPNAGPVNGGTSVTITGTGLTLARAVFFGAVPAAFTVLSDTQIVAVSPPGTGMVTVSVTTPAGTSAAGPSFSYVPPPQI